MHACTKCGRRHGDVEALAGRRLYCDDINAYWTEVRRQHTARYGHPPRVTTDCQGRWQCAVCQRGLLSRAPLRACPGLRSTHGAEQEHDHTPDKPAKSRQTTAPKENPRQ